MEPNITSNTMRSRPPPPARSSSSGSVNYSAATTPPRSRDGATTPSPWLDEEPTGMGLLDLLSMVDRHLTLWVGEIKENASSWKEKADHLVEDTRQRAQRIKLPRVLSDKSLSTMLDAAEVRDVHVLSPKDRERIEKTYKEVRHRANEAFKRIAQTWEEEKTVRLRDKISFFCGVMNLLGTTLMLGFAPEWIPIWYTAQIAVYLPFRAYTYKKKMYHYFLFDLCYAVNALCLIYLWILPGSTFLFEACYGLTLGTLGSAIATWRNSLVFHSLDKTISLAIHILPPLVFTTIRHFIPAAVAEARYPALKALPVLQPGRFILINLSVYITWQLLYYRYVIVARKEKIAQGRATSFTYLINDKRRLIGKIAAKVPEAHREQAFMFGQLIYTIVTLLLPTYVLYQSKFWSSVYLIALFGSSTWSGGSFYLDVFARKFEKELIALRKEFEEQQATIARGALATSSPPTAPSTGASLGVAISGSDSLEANKLVLDELAESENEDAGSEEWVDSMKEGESDGSVTKDDLGFAASMAGITPVPVEKK